MTKVSHFPNNGFNSCWVNWYTSRGPLRTYGRWTHFSFLHYFFFSFHEIPIASHLSCFQSAVWNIHKRITDINQLQCKYKFCDKITMLPKKTLIFFLILIIFQKAFQMALISQFQQLFPFISFLLTFYGALILFL